MGVIDTHIQLGEGSYPPTSNSWIRHWVSNQ